MIYNDIICGAVPSSEVTLDKNELLARLNMGAYFDLDTIKPYLDEFYKVVNYKVAYAIVDLKVEESVADFGFAKVESNALSKVLFGYNKAYIFAVTVGIDVDRLISRLNIKSSIDAYFMDAIGSCAAESLAEYLNDKLCSDKDCTPRFSPGYADFPLDFQRALLERLNSNVSVGITLTENLLMIPTKSITAVIGIK